MDRSLQRILSVRQMRLICTLAHELNLSRCAELLHTTQPAASRALSQLEAQLGLRLFERTTKRITPTSAGLSLVQHAQRILNELDVAEEALRGMGEGITGELRVGLLAAFSPRVLAQALCRARDMLPNVLFMVQTQRADELYASLIEGRIDLMLCHAELSVDLNAVEVHALYEEFSTVLVGSRHRLARRKRPSWQDLANQPWVLPPPNTPLRPKIDRLLSVHRTLAPAPDVQTDSIGLALQLVEDAHMVWAIAHRMAQQFERERAVVPVPVPDVLLRGPMCCFRRRDEAITTPQRVLLDCLRQV